MFRESEAVEQAMFELTDIAPSTFQLILDCIYRGENVITRENALDIWKAASLLQIDFIQNACEVFLKENIDKETCVEVYKCAKHLESKTVSSEVWNKILKEFDYLVSSNDIFLLDADDMKHLVESKDLKINSEDTVVQVIMQWTKLYNDDTNVADANARDTILSTLLRASRLCLASSACLQELLKDNKVIKDAAAFQLLRNALHYHLHPDRRHDFCPSAAAYRACKGLTNVILAIHPPRLKNGELTIIYKRLPEDCWKILCGAVTEVNVMQEHCKALVYENSILVSTSGPSISYPDMFRFFVDERGIELITFQQALSQRLNPAIVCHKNFLYVMGDDNGEVAIERLNLDNTGSHDWKEVGALSKPVSDAMATVLDNFIIIVGNTKQEATKESKSLIQCFDTDTSALHTLGDYLSNAKEKRVFLKCWSGVYLLQEGGDLWWLHRGAESKLITLDYHGRLWDSPVDLNSAVVFKEELIVLAEPLAAPVAAAAQNHAQGQGQNQEIICTQGETRHLFKRVHILRENFCCLMTGVVPSAFLHN